MCRICNEGGDTRLGVCWNCAEAESVIKDGLDMYDKEVAKTPMEKLKFILKQRNLISTTPEAQ